MTEKKFASSDKEIRELAELIKTDIQYRKNKEKNESKIFYFSFLGTIILLITLFILIK